MLTLFVEPERLVRYLHGTGIRVIRHTVAMDGETVDLLTCQLPEETDADPVANEAAELTRQLGESDARARKAEADLIAERKKGQS